jgi:hypothetical protein
VNAGVYSITCLRTGSSYVKPAHNLGNATYKDRKNLKAGVHPNAALQEDFNRYPDFFVYRILEIIEPESHASLEYRALYWMEQMASFQSKGGYNLHDDHLFKPRTSSLKGRKIGSPSEETRKKMSQAKLGKKVTRKLLTATI